MNKLIFTLIILPTIGCGGVHATIWRVNGNPNIDADFHGIQTAINDPYVFPGDTIYVEGYANSYGDFTVLKPLVLIGPGYFLNDNDTTQAIKYEAIIGAVTFEIGSEGSVLAGFYLYAIESGYKLIQINTQGITISRNRIYTVFQSTTTKCGILITNYGSVENVIAQNFIYTKNTGGSQSAPAYGICCEGGNQNVVIKNNRIEVSPQGNGVKRAIGIATEDPNAQIFIYNNVFEGDLSTHYSVLYNNILIDGAVSGNNNTYEYNICNGTQFPAGNGNQQNINPVLVFVDYLSDIDNGYMLLPNSPASGTGMNGVDCGIFGGNTPYALSGIPAVPSIFEINYTGVGSASVPIQVNLKAKSNK
ncbi:MAG: hypothetical protein JW861_13045 [Bacteroidales bacterium]|nr:hypothetical protein [Bacteroidales bacterium]